ncbi:MAG: hypothetical protein WC919_02060 [Candidatus Paceibacterota bacterium]|jgi:hypothetical protein
MPHDDEFDKMEDALQDLAPGGDENPLESPPLKYNPLNHAYPMVADTPLGIIEVMVRFTVVRGNGLPTDMLACAKELRVPASIEDIPVVATKKEIQFFGGDFSGWQNSAEDKVAEASLVDELSNSGPFYLLPLVVRARRLMSGEEGNTDSWQLLTKEETAAIVPGPTLLDLIFGYADKVDADPNAPAGLKDLLNHYTGRGQTPDPDEEWADQEWDVGVDESLN